MLRIWKLLSWENSMQYFQSRKCARRKTSHSGREVSGRHLKDEGVCRYFYACLVRATTAKHAIHWWWEWQEQWTYVRLILTWQRFDSIYGGEIWTLRHLDGPSLVWCTLDVLKRQLLRCRLCWWLIAKLGLSHLGLTWRPCLVFCHLDSFMGSSLLSCSSCKGYPRWIWQ